MKNVQRTLLTVAVTLLTCVTLAGCGKDPAAEMGLSSKEAAEMQEWVDAFHESETVKPSESIQDQSKVPSLKLYEPSQEIKNSKFGDDYVQIRSVTVRDNGSLTVGELLDKLSVDGEVQVYLIPLIGSSTVEITSESIIQENSEAEVRILDENGNELCNVSYINLSNEIAHVFDCKVKLIEGPGGVNSYNFFYSGYLCGAEMSMYKDEEHSDVQEQRWEEGFVKKMTYQNASEILQERGAEYVGVSKASSSTVAFNVYSKEPIYGDKYRVTTYLYNIDMSSGNVGSIMYLIQFVSSEHNPTEYVEYSGDTYLQLVNDDFNQLVKTMTLAVVVNGWGSQERADGTAELVGYFCAKDNSSYTNKNVLYAVFHSDRGTYFSMKVDVRRDCKGNFYIYQCDYPGDPFSSFDEVLENHGEEIKPDYIIRYEQ